MSWFDTKGFANLAKNALKEAQKKIDQALDIQIQEETMGVDQTSVGIPATSEKAAPPILANKEKNKTEPNTPVTETSIYANKATSVSVGSTPMMTTTWGSFTGSFFDNPNANEMVTTPPKANTSIAEIAPTAKRQSVTSNSDSVELLSPPTSPSSDLPTPSDAVLNTSESVELITATNTSDIITPDSESSLPESIVIIASNDAVDEEEEEDESVSYSTVMDETITAASIEGGQLLKQMSSPSCDESINLSSTSTEMIRSIASGLTHSKSSTGTVKLTMSMDETQTVDSDSTQSFEEIQMQSSSTQSSGTNDDKCRKRSLQSYNSLPNSNDENETTTTSSDIEIISNPNGDSSSQNSTTRASPLKLKMVLNDRTIQLSSTQTSKKGHHREVSEVSILSEDSQSELDKLAHRITELNEILEAREMRLLQSERQNAELQERNGELQSTIDALKRNSVSLDSAEEYTQRVSALEKKFQASIRERDSLRVQIKSLKDELKDKVPKDDLKQVEAESNNMISELRLEGEKLSKEVLQQSNIIKKLRAKEKTTDAQLKRNKEEITSLSDELERSKKTLNAKEEVERSQIEAVHKMSSEKRKLENENAQYKSQLEDLQIKLATLQTSFDVVKAELQQRSKLHTDLSRSAEEAVSAKKEKEAIIAENREMLNQMNELKEKLRSIEQESMKREQQLREENRKILKRVEEAESRAEISTQEVSITTVPLMRQLESLQNTLTQRTNNWNEKEKDLLKKLETSEAHAKSLKCLEESFSEKLDLLQTRCMELEEKLSHSLMQEEKTKLLLQQTQLDGSLKDSSLKKEICDLKESLAESEEKIKFLMEKNRKLEENMERKNQTVEGIQQNINTEADGALTRQISVEQEQIRMHSPTNSFDMNSIGDAMGGSVDWQADDLDCISNSGRPSLMYGLNLNIMGHNASTLEHLQSLLKQRDGELAHLQWELSRLQAERDVLNDEISNLTLQLENLKEKLQAYEILESDFNGLQHRYDELLQMYGEKVERTEELELDLVELKEAYKAQIDELLAQPTNPESKPHAKT